MKVTNEIKVGIMVVISLVLLSVLTVKTGNFNLSPNKGYAVTVRFHDIDGVNLNSPVMVNGYEVGHVDNIAIRDTEGQSLIEVSLWIKNTVKLRKGTKAYIKNLGFMGEKYVGLKSSGTATEYIQSGDVLTGEDPVDFMVLVEKGQSIADHVERITSNIDERLTKNQQYIDSLIVHAGETMEGMSALVKNANERITVNEKKIDSIVDNFYSVSTNLDEMSADLKLNPWKLLYHAKEKKRGTAP